MVDPPEGEWRLSAALDQLAELARAPSPAPGAIKTRPRSSANTCATASGRRRVAAAWAQGLRTPAAMLPTVYDDVPKEAYPLAERQILAHLERLRRKGEIS